MADKTLFTQSCTLIEELRVEESSSVEQTLQIAKTFAKQKLEIDNVVCLIGDLGAGKTHFVKGIATAFGASSAEVHSPTYTLVNEYPTTPPLFHFDLYRLNSVLEVVDIGFEEYLYSAGICVIEWPELVIEMLPTTFWLVQINSISAEKRQIQISHYTH
jgi:tRNA threonylcarbamoyladenosine biosynthesis protein TsaE